MKYSDVIVDWLAELGYTHCFFVAGGNIMHLLDGVRKRMTCVPFVHEVAAGIAAEVFNEARAQDGPRAFAMVTAGPGVTNILTAMAGAWLESRELLVLAGQVKSSDLAGPGLRQRGIQEIDGVALAASLAKRAERIERPISKSTFVEWVEQGREARKGPVFLEFCLDAQGAPVERAELERDEPSREAREVWAAYVERAALAAARVAELVRRAERPVFLIGGGVGRATAARVRARLEAASVAVMTTWNGMDRVDSGALNYCGRPNQWGQRRANVLVQQADLIVAFGTRLGMQQTGFNHAAFAPEATIVQIELDAAELEKGHPRVDLALQADADTLLERVLHDDLGDHAPWLAFAARVNAALPLQDPENVTRAGYVDPFAFARHLAQACTAGDVVVPCSSGGAFTTMMQAFDQKFGQIVVTNKGLASMGYGLSAAIGAALARPGSRTIGVEGDGGFTQNLQELATVAVNRLDLKMFVFSNEGYASIRMTQRNYFGGDYLGCDTQTGLGFPDWSRLFAAYGIPSYAVNAAMLDDTAIRAAFETPGPAAFVVPIDPEQTYYPKISSRVTATGGMESAPLHEMTPALPDDVRAAVMRYIGTSPARV
ncbi:MAG: acetolactate synthase large subunit [Vulcanimicrobiaceae bacterium]